MRNWLNRLPTRYTNLFFFLSRNLMLPNLWFNFGLVLTTNITPWGSTMAQLKHWYVFGHNHNASSVTRQGECVPYSMIYMWYNVKKLNYWNIMEAFKQLMHWYECSQKEKRKRATATVLKARPELLEFICSACSQVEWCLWISKMRLLSSTTCEIFRCQIPARYTPSIIRKKWKKIMPILLT